MTNRQSRRGNQHTRDDKRRLKEEENVVHLKTIAAMIGMKPRVGEATTVNEKSKTFGTVSTISTETRKKIGEASKVTAVSPDERFKETRTTSVELGILMTNLNEIDKKLKCSEENRLELKKETRPNKNENLDNYYCLARAPGTS